jgi:[ribosomal protein S5]-alanine N-acetyltransferase
MRAMSVFAKPELVLRTTSRLHLRPPSLADLGFTADLFACTELVAHRPHPEPDSPEASRARLERNIEHWQRHGFGRWAIERDGMLIGFGGVAYKAGFEGLNIS